MKLETNETLSAFLDGEAVGDLALAEALSAPGGREALVDFVLLRSAMTSAADRPSEEFYKKMNVGPVSQAAQRAWLPLAAAAAVVLFAAVGLWALRLDRTLETKETAPGPVPAATRTLHFERGVDWQGQG